MMEFRMLVSLTESKFYLESLQNHNFEWKLSMLVTGEEIFKSLKLI